MSPSLTKEEKARLIKDLESLKRSHVEYLRRVVAKVASNSERKVQRRLNKVSMTVRAVPMRDVLSLERITPPTIAKIRQMEMNRK